MSKPKAIDDIVDGLRALGYAPEVSEADRAWNVVIRLGTTPTPINATITERVAKTLDAKRVHATVKMLHEQAVRYAARRLGLLETTYRHALHDAFRAADPEGFAGHQVMNGAAKAVLALMAPPHIARNADHEWGES